MTNKTIAFIGGGNMASSLIGGLINRDWPPGRLCVADPSPEARERLSGRFGIRVFTDNAQAARDADVLVLAVKPQVIADAARPLAALVAERRPLVVSVAAGVPVAALSGWLGRDTALVRVMPNTPALIGEGASALFANERVDAAQRQLAESLLGAAGRTVWVEDEDHMHAVTAVSGSGPAYFFYLLEALIAAAREAGLPEPLARELVLKTGQGTCAMALDSDEPPAELRRRVTSPGGTTERALELLDEGEFVRLVEKAVLGAAQRSRELSEKLDD